MVMNSINMRSSKMKFLIYGCVVCGMLSTIYLLSTTHNRLKNVKGAYDTCMQQKDSLLAQLQVVYEQKSRVEKSLQKEKSDHAKTKEDYQEINQFKLVLEREKQNSEGKYNTLQQEHQTLQDKFTQLTSDSSQLTEKLNQLEENFHKYQAEAEKLAQSKENEVKKLNGDMSALILSKEQLSINYKKSEKNLQLLTEKLRSIQAANSLQQDQGASKPEAIQQNHPEGEEKINNSDKVSPKKPQETNLNASPTESNKVQSQENDKPKNGGGITDSTKTSSTNNESPNKGGGIEPRGDGALINGAAAKKDPSDTANGPPPETNDVNVKPEEEKSKVKLEPSLDEKGLENVPVKTLDKPKTSDGSTPKSDNQIALVKPKPEYLPLKEENSQVLPQPNNLDTEQKEAEAKGMEGDIGAQSQNENNFNNHPQENGDINAAVPWEKSLKRGPQQLLKQPNAGGMVGVPGNHRNDDDDYREEDDEAAEDDAVEEGLPAGEKMAHEKHFQDHDFEDNEGDQNRAKEEAHDGVVVLPK